MNRATKEGFVDVGWRARGDRLNIDSDPLKFRGITYPQGAAKCQLNVPRAVMTLKWGAKNMSTRGSSNMKMWRSSWRPGLTGEHHYKKYWQRKANGFVK